MYMEMEPLLSLVPQLRKVLSACGHAAQHVAAQSRATTLPKPFLISAQASHLLFPFWGPLPLAFPCCRCRQLFPILFLSSLLVFAVVAPISSAGSRCLSPHQISKGPTFTCMFRVTMVVPTVHFSTTRINFGACFLYHAGMPPARQTLVITNKADRDIR